MAKIFHGGRTWPAGDFLFHSAFKRLGSITELAIPVWNNGTALVKQGQEVAAHSAVGADAHGLPVFTPLAGKVSAVKDFAELAVRPRRFNIGRLTIQIAVGEKAAAEPAPVFKPHPRYWELTKDELTNRLHAAGVIDLKNRPLPKTIVFDGLDPEPPLSTNLRLLMERPAELLDGMRIVMQIHGAVRARLAVPDDQPALFRQLKSMLASSVNLHPIAVENRYPARHPALLAACIGLPGNSAIYGMETALRIKQAVMEGRPLTAKFVTVWDEWSQRRANIELPIGATVEQALGLKSESYDGYKIALGGMLSGACAHSVKTPVGRDIDGILLIDAAREPRKAPCFNCGQCLEACPAGLAPSQIFRMERDSDAARLVPGACLGCGLCSYICPAGLDLSHQMRIARNRTAEAG
ncbi:MAG: 4Fe-4S dicluster domain-containing protein [Candidatus Edwardsbacteria bacterium]|nr:4Fe-4S dicluster domain-containing protein [Candidatus Edwardsbacteria bacterium]